MSADNYTTETAFLFRMLRTEAFWFVIVRYNHYSILQDLKKDLRAKYPDRPSAEINAQNTTYRELVDAYYALEKGFFFIENFREVLKNPELYAGLNQRRDKLAKYPIAIIAFIEPPSEAHFGKEIMEKMPDLWSFRSLLMDLRREVVEGDQFKGISRSLISIRENFSPSTLGGQSSGEKVQELERLEQLLVQTPESEIAYRRTLYPQIVELLVEVGRLEDARQRMTAWEMIAEREDQGTIERIKGRIQAITGEKRIVKETAFVPRHLAHKAVDTADLARSDFWKKGKYASERRLLTGLSVLPQEAIPLSVLNDLFSAKDQSTLKRQLAKFGRKGFVAFEQEKEDVFYEIHPKVKEIVLAKNSNVLEDVRGLIDRLKEKLAYEPGTGHFVNATYEAASLYAWYGEYLVGVVKKVDHDLAILCERLGRYHYTTGNLEQALTFFQQENTLEKELYKAHPENTSFKHALAASYQYLGNTQSYLGNLDQALAFFEQCNALEKELHSDFPNNIAFKNALAISYSKLGDTLSSLGNLDLALTFYQQYNTLEKELYEVYPSNVSFKKDLAISNERLGETHGSLGNLEQALTFFEQCNALATELYEAHSSNVVFKNGLAVSYFKLGELHEKKQDLPKALPYFQQTETLLSELVTAFPQNVEFTKNLAEVQEKLAELGV